MDKACTYSAMEAPLLAIGEAGTDIVPAVYDRFFTRFPEERAKFLNFEAAAERMVNETLEALVGLSENASWAETTVINFVDLHRDYGVIAQRVYAGFVDIVVEAVGEAAGDAWTPASKAAWHTQAQRLKAMIAAAG
ncbi:globin [Sphingorhabdus sp. Alg239-R122]|uniref:globin n=1 Tax=Sphingorhabdus sp. Alg239-R122 TaxID=2305989 RepID=UPI0013DAF1CA|nr:globin [Sphingorhabdus sp. Alg239-R122]